MRVRTQSRLKTGYICGAKTRKGTACLGMPLENGRCLHHGGLSTGPKSSEGRARIATAQSQRHAAARQRAKLLRDAEMWYTQFLAQYDPSKLSTFKSLIYEEKSD